VVIVAREEEIVEIRIIRITSVQEVIVVAIATMIIIEVEVEAHIEGLVEATEEMVDLGQVILQAVVVIAT